MATSVESIVSRTTSKGSAFIGGESDLNRAGPPEADAIFGSVQFTSFSSLEESSYHPVYLENNR
jgi:hypothetical protein